LSQGRICSKVHQQTDATVILRRRHTAQVRDIVFVHRENEIESLEVCDTHLPCTQARQIEPATSRCLDCASIWRTTDVVTMRPGRIDLHGQPRRPLRHHAPKNRLCGWGAANVAHTDK